MKEKSIFILILISLLTVLTVLNLKCNKDVQTNSSQEIKYFTPDNDLNILLKNGDVNPTKVFGISMQEEGLTINPVIKKGWTWLAAKNIPFENKSYSFFFYEGLLYTNTEVFTNHRRMKFQEDVSDEIKSDAFTIAFYSDKGKESELIIFFGSEDKNNVNFTLSDKFDGKEHSYTIALDESGYKVISILFTPEESHPYYFSKTIDPRSSQSLNKDWLFHKGSATDALGKKVKSSAWDSVSIPHSWNTTDVYDTRNKYDNIDFFPGYYRGEGWYRKEFTVSKKMKDKYLKLGFEAVNQVADVWLNGKYLGQHLGGYTGFSFPINDEVKFGRKKNLLIVKADNAYHYDIPPHSADFVHYGGIYRDVRINISPLLRSENIKVTTDFEPDGTAFVSVSGTIKNSGSPVENLSIICNIVKENSEIVATMKEDISSLEYHKEINFKSDSIQNPNLWSPNSPYLYRLKVSLESDGVVLDDNEIKFGFRFYEFDSNKGFSLNGETIKLKGVNKHQDYFGMGYAVPDELQIRDLRIIKEMGANFIRLAHYPQDPAVLDACDSLGLLVWEEIPFVNTMGGENFKINTKNMLREMIERDFNHPSIILWGFTNESAMRFTNKAKVDSIMKFYRELNGLAKKLDPSRLTAQAHNHIADKSMGNMSDVLGRNRYYGWYNGVLDDFAKELDREHEVFPNWKIIISEYGVGSKRGFHVENPVKFDFSEEYQCKFNEVYWREIAKRDFVAGGLIWNMFDFGSTVKKGNIPRVNQKGMCDFARKPKDVYYFYQSQWTEKPMVYIVSHTRRFYFGNKAETKSIRVYSNCDKVELFHNGESLGKKQNQYVFRWNVNFVPGKNYLKAFACKDGHVVEDQINIIYQIKN